MHPMPSISSMHARSHELGCERLSAPNIISGPASPIVLQANLSRLMDPDFADTLCPLRLLSLGRPKILKPKRGLMDIWPILPRYRFVQRWFELERASWPDSPAILQDDPSSPARSPSPGSPVLPERKHPEVFATLSGDRKAELCGYLSTVSCSHASSETVLLPFPKG